MAVVFRFTPGEDVPVLGSKPYRERPGFTREIFSNIEVCSICGGDKGAASGYWQGIEVVTVCPHCAVKILPRLIADAVLGECAGHDDAIPNLRRRLETIKKNYWRAAATAISRAKNRKAS